MRKKRRIAREQAPDSELFFPAAAFIFAQWLAYNEDLDIPLEELFSSQYVASRLGRLPLDSVRKLQFYNNRPFIWTSFGKDNNYSWGIYLTTNEYERDVDNLFTSLYFERMYIPDFVEGTPENAKENLNQKIEVLEKELKECEANEEKLKEQSKDRYDQFSSVLEHVSKIFEARKYVLDFGERFSITGFVPSYKVNSLRDMFRSVETAEIEVHSAHDDRRLTPPHKEKNGWFANVFKTHQKKSKKQTH